MKKLIILISLFYYSQIQAQQYGYLVISCNKDEVPIYLDGEQVGIFPIEETLKLSTGSHTISFFPGRVTAEVREPGEHSYTKSDVFRTLYGMGLLENLPVVYRTVRSVEGEAIWAKHKEIIKAGTKEIYIIGNDTIAVFVSTNAVNQLVQDVIRRDRERQNQRAVFLAFCGTYLVLAVL